MEQHGKSQYGGARMKIKNFEVSVLWLVNHMIHGSHDIFFIDNDTNKVICTWADDYYYQHMQELHERLVNFISVGKSIIKVFLKGEKK